MTQHKPDDSLLMAYADGELDDAGAAEVERAAAADPVLARRLRDILDSNGLLRAAFGGVLHEKVPDRLLKALEPRTNARRRGRLLALAASIALVVAGGVWLSVQSIDGLPYQIVSSTQNRWLDAVTGYHQVYARTVQRDDRQLIDVGAQDVAYLEEWFGRRLNRAVKLPNLDIHGLSIQGGRVIFVEGQAGAQFYYQGRDGALVSIVVAVTKRATAEPQTVKRAGLNVVHWRHAGYFYAVTGEMERHLLMNIALMMSEEMEKT